MYKLVILIEPLDDEERFEEHWPKFLRAVEAMPGLRREATSRVISPLYGQAVYTHMHELFFDDLASAERALSSPTGQVAGGLLQQISQGRLVLFFAEHKEDDLTHILQYRTDGDAGA